MAGNLSREDTHMAPHSRPRRRRWLVGSAIVLVAALALGAFLLTRPRGDDQVAWDIVRATRSTQVSTVSLAGTIAPRTRANVTFRVPGTVERIAVKVGDTVTAGEVLATVDPVDLEAAVALTEAQASAARAQLSTVLDTDGATDAQVAAAQAQVRSADAGVTNARNRLADARLTSPIDGTVAQVAIAVGDQVSGSGGSASGGGSLGGLDLGSLTGGTSASSGATGAHVVIISTDGWQMDAGVGTADLPGLKAGQTARVTPTGTSSVLDARVDTVGIAATSTSGATATFPITLTIEDDSVPLFSGASADAVVTVGTYPDVLTVPVTAVTTSDGRSTVRLVRAGAVSDHEVTIGRRFDSNVEVTSGLTAGDEVQVPRAQVITEPTANRFGPPGDSEPTESASAGR